MSRLARHEALAAMREAARSGLDPYNSLEAAQEVIRRHLDAPRWPSSRRTSSGSARVPYPFHKVGAL